MERAENHHSRRFFRPATPARLCAAALFVLVAAALAGVMPMRAVPLPQESSGQGAKSEYDPRRASLDVKVGKFYFNRGKYDAALSRFFGAVKHDPHWAVPYRYIGQAFEKKNDPKHAIAAYRTYLKIDPHAKDAKAIRKRIAKLEFEIKRRSAQRG